MPLTNPSPAPRCPSCTTITQAEPVAPASSQPDAARLVEEHQHVAQKIAAWFARRHPRLADDFLSDSLLALWKAAKRYDPSRGPFDRFAGRFVRSACVDVLKAQKRKGRDRDSLPLEEAGVPCGREPDPAFVVELDEQLQIAEEEGVVIDRPKWSAAEYKFAREVRQR